MKNIEEKLIPFVDIFSLPPEIDKSTSSIWFRAYAIHGVPRKLVPHLNEIYPCQLKVLDRRVWMRFLTLGQAIELQDLSINLITAEDGGLEIVIRSNAPKSIPASCYCFVYTVFDDNGRPGNEKEVKGSLDAVIGLLRLHFGLSAFYQIAADQELKLADGRMQMRTDAIRIPQKNEGPFLHPVNWLDSEEILQSLTSHRDARRLILAMEYIHKGFSDADFAAYWIALELICNSHQENKIIEKLVDAYGFPFKKIKNDNVIGYKEFLKARQRFFHKGIRPTFPADSERYLQLMLLDLLRSELGLTAKKHAVVFARSGPDLAPLSLTPKRDLPSNKIKKAEPPTEEEKAAVIRVYEAAISEYERYAEAVWPRNES